MKLMVLHSRATRSQKAHAVEIAGVRSKWGRSYCLDRKEDVHYCSRWERFDVSDRSQRSEEVEDVHDERIAVGETFRRIAR